jgi:uncharacterized glyoxalase superfamily protein PhnB
MAYAAGMEKIDIKRITPIHVVEAIEPALAYWERLGFEKLAEVPHEGHLGFVLLARGGAQVMLQTRASVAADVPAMAPVGAALYIDVASLDAAIEASRSLEVIVPRRTTFYGADEIWVRDPAGVVIGFAQSK